MGQRSPSLERRRHRGVKIQGGIEQEHGQEHSRNQTRLVSKSKRKKWWKHLAEIDMNSDVQALIIEYILVEPHIADIRACAQTCRFWRARCLPLLFPIIRLRSMHKMAQFLFLTQHDVFSCIRRVHETSPVVRFVRVLILDYSNNAELDQALSFILQVKRKLTSLTTLSVHHDHPRNTTELSPHASDLQKLEKSLPCNFGGLQKLRIDACRFGAFTDLLRIVLAAPQLEQLECNDVHWGTQNILPSSYTLHPTLRWVRMRRCTSGWPLFSIWATKDRAQRSGPGSLFPGIAVKESLFLQKLGRYSQHLSKGDIEFRLETLQDSKKWALRVINENNLLTLQINILPHTSDHVTSERIDTIIFVGDSASDLRASYAWSKLAEHFENNVQDLKSLSLIILDLQLEDDGSPMQIFPDTVRAKLRVERFAWSNGIPADN